MKLHEYFALERGRCAKVAARVGVAPAYMSQMATGNRPVPAERAPAIVDACEGQVQRWELRDDWYRIWPELVGALGAPPIPSDRAVPSVVPIERAAADGGDEPGPTQAEIDRVVFGTVAPPSVQGERSSAAAPSVSRDRAPGPPVDAPAGPIHMYGDEDARERRHGPRIDRASAGDRRPRAHARRG